MSILEKIARIYAPFCCIGCDTETDRMVCESCLGHLLRVPSRCYLCRMTTRNCQVCVRCRKISPLAAVIVFGVHEGLAKELVHKAKYERAKAGLHEMSGMMSSLVPYSSERDMVIVPVPTASSRVRERGYDQAVVLAKDISKTVSLQYFPVLVRLNQAHQVGSTRADRKRHVKNGFRVVKPDIVKGRSILLIDDVCTTGATLEEAARTLKRAGAASVYGLVFSQPN